VHTRFKKGQSGNPRGPRPKSLPALLVEALNDKVVVTIDGERREISKREAVATQLVNKSTGADLRATRCSASRPGLNGDGRPRAQPGGQELADKLSRDCRRITASDWYRRIFPTRLSPERQAVSEFEATAQGCRLATSVGGVLTGHGADLIIIEDPLKPEEALSETQRRAANEWFDHTHYSRLNDKIEGASRDHAPPAREPALGHDPGDDLVGHVLAQEDWEVVRFPAIAEDDEAQIVDTVWGPKLLTRHQGEALHPAREPLSMLEHLRQMIGE